jgi:hypothetical protein
MNGWCSMYLVSMRRSSIFAWLLLLWLLPAVIGHTQEAAEDAGETAAESGKRAERMLEAQQSAQNTQRRQSDLAERERARARDAELQELFEAQRKQAEGQRAEFEGQREAYMRVLDEMKRLIEQQGGDAGRRGGALDLARNQLAEIEAKLREEAKLLDKASRRKSAEAAPLPENAQFTVFKLKYVQPDEVAAVVSKILLAQSPRIAVDERSNTLLAIGDETQIERVRGVLQALDVPSHPGEASRPAETLQLRIVWLLDGVQGGKSPERFVSPQVVEALAQLGFAEPKVVTQQVTTLTISDDKRQGRFQFNVPVIINGQSWQFGGDGQISPLGDDRYSLGVELNYVRDPRTNLERGQLSGSIFTPLGHYTVMGTTTFVGSAAAAVADGAAPGGEAIAGMEGGAAMSQQEYLSAFVVYLDRAKEFPGEAAKSERLNIR